MPALIKRVSSYCQDLLFIERQKLTIPMKGANLGASSDSMIVVVAVGVGKIEVKTVDDTATRDQMGEEWLRRPVLKLAS
jgi:hypothetical protein